MLHRTIESGQKATIYKAQNNSKLIKKMRENTKKIIREKILTHLKCNHEFVASVLTANHPERSRTHYDKICRTSFNHSAHTDCE